MADSLRNGFSNKEDEHFEKNPLILKAAPRKFINFIVLNAEVAACRAAYNETLQTIKALHAETPRNNTALVVDSFAGRSYENTFRISFIQALFNDGKGLTVSPEYFHADKATRKYSNKTDPKLMEDCRKQLRKLGWEEKAVKFDEVEMDCVLRCHVDLDAHPVFAESAKILVQLEQD